MFEVRQFKPALYILIILGMTGFAFALETPGLWAISIVATLINFWLVHTKRFRPLPRLVANAITLLGVLCLAMITGRGSDTPIFVIGQFLVLLQIVKLFEQRANRDYGQLLI